METIEADIHIQTPIERVWELFTDTDVYWMTRFEVRIPLVGMILAAIFYRVYKKRLLNVLKQANVKLEV